jgi:hypothetical protein
MWHRTRDSLFSSFRRNSCLFDHQTI